jgi:2-hydroxycyclohexanecarboxyl-CoA dehydrogenase
VGGEFAGRRVLVTGGARGIGLAAARRFVEEGAQVVVWALHPESAQAAVKELGAAAHGVARDLGDPKALVEGWQETLGALGGLDVLVNNAGYTRTQPFSHDDEAYQSRVLAVNLTAVLSLTRLALPYLEQAQGCVVNVVSDAGRVGMSGEAVYSAAKGGVIAFTKALAQEEARQGVRANCVSPGPTRTRVLTENLADPAQGGRIERMLARIPLRRPAEPEEVAEAVVFLASPRAAYITGQVLSVSGGLTMV